jgi:formylglycine-generating enzyme required for sulfatase activity
MNRCLPRLFASIAVIAVSANAADAAAPAGRYVVSTATVTDTKTKLIWQRAVPSTTYTWADAIAYCTGVGASLGGAAFRLPTRKELQTLIDESRTNPAIDPTAFPNTPPGAFWSSSPVVDSPSYAWNVYFYNGSTYDAPVVETFSVRCVR